MEQFLENYFNIICLFITLFTSLIFVTFMLLKKKLDTNSEGLHTGALITISVYEVLHLVLLLYVAMNVILRLYVIFISISLAMLVYVEVIYLIKFLRVRGRKLSLQK